MQKLHPNNLGVPVVMTHRVVSTISRTVVQQLTAFPPT